MVGVSITISFYLGEPMRYASDSLHPVTPPSGLGPPHIQESGDMDPALLLSLYSTRVSIGQITTVCIIILSFLRTQFGGLFRSEGMKERSLTKLQRDARKPAVA